MKDALKIVGELVTFARKLAKGSHGECILPLVGLLVITSKDVTVHVGSRYTKIIHRMRKC